jgi:hypothetical protein
MQGDSVSKETAEWARSWAEKLPLQACMRLMQHLLPQLEHFCKASNVNDENTVVEFLRVRLAHPLYAITPRQIPEKYLFIHRAYAQVRIT